MSGDSVRDLRVGEMIPGTEYCVTSVLGHGSNSTLYTVDGQFRQGCAAKAYWDGGVGLPQNALRHRSPNVVTVHEVTFAKGGRQVVIMERLDGASCRRLLWMKQTIAARNVLDIGIPASRGLVALHESGITHGAIMAEKIFVHAVAASRHVDVKLLLSSRARMPAFEAAPLAPELMAGSPMEPPADVFALGVVLYELIAGRVPLRVAEPLPIPSELAELLRRCTASDAGVRPRAREVARQLEEIRVSLPIIKPEETAPLPPLA